MQEITIEKLNESFYMARELLEAGELSATKKLIELYVDRVTVYKNHVDVLFKFHPDLTFDNSDDGSGRRQVSGFDTIESTSMGSGREKARPRLHQSGKGHLAGGFFIGDIPRKG